MKKDVELTTLISKSFGGEYLTEAIVKDVSDNKIYLRLGNTHFSLPDTEILSTCHGDIQNYYSELIR